MGGEGWLLTSFFSIIYILGLVCYKHTIHVCVCACVGGGGREREREREGGREVGGWVGGCMCVK